MTTTPTPGTPTTVLPGHALHAMTNPAWVACNSKLIDVAPSSTVPLEKRLFTFRSTTDTLIYAGFLRDDAS